MGNRLMRSSKSAESVYSYHNVYSTSPNNFHDLHYASFHGNYEKVKECLLIDSTDIDITDSFGRTPLHFACAANHVTIAHLLLKYGASKNIIDDFGRLPYDVATEYSSHGVLSILY